MFYHFRESATFDEKFIWRTDLNNAASIHHDNFIIVGDSVQSVSNSDHSCVLELRFDAILNEEVCLHVNI